MLFQKVFDPEGDHFLRFPTKAAAFKFMGIGIHSFDFYDKYAKYIETVPDVVFGQAHQVPCKIVEGEGHKDEDKTRYSS